MITIIRIIISKVATLWLGTRIGESLRILKACHPEPGEGSSSTQT